MGGLESQCRPASDCAVWYDLVVNYLPESLCKLANGVPGSCCPDIPSNGIDCFEKLYLNPRTNRFIFILKKLEAKCFHQLTKKLN